MQKMNALMAAGAVAMFGAAGTASAAVYEFDTPGDAEGWAFIQDAGWTAEVTGGNLVITADTDPAGGFALSQLTVTPTLNPGEETIRLAINATATGGNFRVRLVHDPRPDEATTDTEGPWTTIASDGGMQELELLVSAANIGAPNFWKIDYAEFTTAPGASLLIDSVVLEGVPVPEPASLALLGLGGLAALRRRR